MASESIQELDSKKALLSPRFLAETGTEDELESGERKSKELGPWIGLAGVD
jgi:hypothetical protein